MTGWLLDTNVLSELWRPTPASAVRAFVAVQPLETGRKAGLSFSQPDLIIASIALHGLTVVTRDGIDYERARVPVLDA